MADRLAALLGRLGVPLSQARALDMIARISGLPDWERMRTGLLRLEGAQVPMADHALTRILRLDADKPITTVRAIDAVWGAHLTDHERTHPVLSSAREWLRAATGCAHLWAAARRVPLTPDLLRASLDVGSDVPHPAHRFEDPYRPPRLLDLHRWAIAGQMQTHWTDLLAETLARVPGFDGAAFAADRPQSAQFRQAASERMRLTMRPLGDLIDEVRMEEEDLASA